jgi:hypothetical protein
VEKSVSFRSELVAKAADLIKEIDIDSTRPAMLISGIVSQLAAYTEEGTPLSPSVFICNSITNLTQQAGAGFHIQLSENIEIDTAGPKILKAAAPLCTDNWNVYIELSANMKCCSFGVFCGSADPSSLTVDEIALDSYADGFPVIRILQTAINKVEVRTNAGSAIEFRFNDDTDIQKLEERDQVSKLSRAISKNILDGEAFAQFIERILASAIRKCHGTLIAVAPCGGDITTKEFKDSVALMPPIDLYKMFKSHADEGKTASTVGRLQVASELVAGFIRSDGITVFANDGTVVCYRAFIHGGENSTPASGGARSRAFRAMTALLPSSLEAAFFRSQDGRTELQCKVEG